MYWFIVEEAGGGLGDPLEQQRGRSLSSELLLSQNTRHDGQKLVPGSMGSCPENLREVQGDHD